MRRARRCTTGNTGRSPRCTARTGGSTPPTTAGRTYALRMIKKLYERTSRTITVSDIRPDVLATIEAHSGARMLGPVTGAVACVETRSVSLKKPGFFARLGGAPSAAEHHTYAVLTPSALVVATVGAGRDTTVLS